MYQANTNKIVRAKKNNVLQLNGCNILLMRTIKNCGRPCARTKVVYLPAVYYLEGFMPLSGLSLKHNRVNTLLVSIDCDKVDVGFFLQAVLVRVAADSLWASGSTNEDKRIARVHSNIIVIAILITSTLGSALTTVLGPVLLSQDSRIAPAGSTYILYFYS